MTFSRIRIPILMLTLVAACLTQGTLISPRISGSENTPSWTQTSGPPGGSFQVIELSPKDSNILFAGSNRSLFRSTDRGEHWQRVEALHQLSARRELQVGRVAFDPRNPEIVYAVTEAGVSKSEDAGRSWRKIEEGMPSEQWVFSCTAIPLIVCYLRA